ncbi:MAG: HEAT repeat domain-containing protein, partial [Acidobacteria bacterium]|nr:HEAT repeat domain-containing protein [Acidobacteriota bacterium]
ASSAKEDLVSQLLRVPAPPPPNPLVPPRSNRDELFYSKRKVPSDDAPIRELMDYWRQQSSRYQNLRYMPKPSSRVMDRLRAEIVKDPKSVVGFLNIFNDSRDGAEFVKNIYDNWTDDERDGEGGKERLNTWLSWNSPHHVRQLEKAAQKAGERGEYVTNFDQLVALAKYDWDSARPTVDRLYGDASQPVSRVTATWALYGHALEDNSLGDIDRYRDELKAIVEDKKASAGMRDLAMDALVKEKEWSGRDDWYFTLLEDETLADLRVNGSTYTGLTTIILNSHPDRFADKMIELVKSTNPVVRSAAARNLAVMLDPERPDVIKALLPWLEDPNWATDTNGSRMRVLQALQRVKVPESAPALIKLLDEKETYYVDPNANAANAAATAANTMANAANAMVRASNAVSATSFSASNANSIKGKPVTHYPLRDDAVRALTTQEDMRALPALRRILGETEGYQRGTVVKAIFKCKGYTVAEQANALETMARSARDQMARIMAETGLTEEALRNDLSLARTATNSYITTINDVMSSPQGVDFMLGGELTQVREPGDALIREVIARMSQHEKREPEIAEALRGFLLMWKGPAVNSLFLKDLKDGKADVHSVVKLLSIRKELQEKHSGEVSDARRGGPVQSAIGACLMESEDAYPEILNGDNPEAKAALLGCARLIRAKLPVKEVAKFISHADKRLAAAAESFLESEDSAEARNIVLSLHPNEAKIMGATTGFWPERNQVTVALGDLFDSMPGGSPNNANPILGYLLSASGGREIEGEKPLRDEIKKDTDLVGAYSYLDNVIRIYKDKVAYTWGKDDSRYNERFLSKEEFDRFTGYLSSQNVDEMAPFLDCEQYNCETNQLLM